MSEPTPTIPVSNPLFRLWAILAAALSLSIGWGIRGNYGHELGAMFPGAIAAIAVCLLSGREDWRERVAFFAFFGALAWGFGGSMSYGQVIGYTHSGHYSTQLFGFAALFLIGFLWAALGGAGTALPAVLDRQRLTEMFKPLTVLLTVWAVMYFALDDVFYRVMQVEGASQRHESGLYWFDSDWIEVGVVLVGLLLFDFFDRRFENGFLLPIAAILGAAAGTVAQFGAEEFVPGALLRQFEREWPTLEIVVRANVGWVLGALVGLWFFFRHNKRLADDSVENGFLLVVFAGAAALVGYGLQYLITMAGLAQAAAERLVRYQGDVAGGQYSREQLVTNWPNLALDFPQHVGWAVGLILGVAAYFARYGTFRRGSSLFVHMAVGWFVGFLLFPVLLDIRMTPPRSDNWAGVLGTFVGAVVYFLRSRLQPVVVASLACGTIGGLGFSGAAWLKLMMVSFGNPHLVDEPGLINAWSEWHDTPEAAFPEILRDPAFVEKWQHVLEPWQHWQSANWHSFLEQAYGFINGIGLIVALALLVTRVATLDDKRPRRAWTEIFALTFVLPVLIYLNMVKNLNEWTSQHAGHQPLPSLMRAPLFGSIELSASAWFHLLYWIAAGAFILLMIVHVRGRRLDVVPATWLGRGQLIYLLLAWAFVLGDWTKYIVAFRENRLITEGVILLNAVIATILVLSVPRQSEAVRKRPAPRWNTLVAATLVVAVLVAAAAPLAQTWSVRQVYGDAHTGHADANHRFGPKANWRISPLLKGQRHR